MLNISKKEDIFELYSNSNKYQALSPKWMIESKSKGLSPKGMIESTNCEKNKKN